MLDRHRSSRNHLACETAGNFRSCFWGGARRMNLLFMNFIAMHVLTRAVVHAQYDQCTGITSWIKDGYCDEENNNPECDYDGGDCCYCSCVDDLEYPCRYVGYNCLDPEFRGREIQGCHGTVVAESPCTDTSPQQWIVDDTASAAALADAVYCSGGTFMVEWHGHVLVNRTIEVANATVLHLTGVGSKAEMEAASDARLLTIIDSSLNATNIKMSGGNATFGGAIAASNSLVVLDKISLTDNRATAGGGALYAAGGSGFFCGKISFDRNQAGETGGAFHIGDESSITFDSRPSFLNNIGDDELREELLVYPWNESWAAGASFTNNYAASFGGASYVESSAASWVTDALFHNNTAGDFIEHGAGGAVHAIFSDVSWAANVSFSNNIAGDTGGGIHILLSSALWMADVSFTNNTAIWSGGALYVEASSVTWVANASFTTNTAYDFGGALYLRYSTASWSTDAAFLSNVAGAVGGAVYSYGSTVSWAMDRSFERYAASSDVNDLNHESDSGAPRRARASFVKNAAGTHGGALYLTALTDVLLETETLFSGNRASGDGGAVYIFASYGETQNSSLHLSGTTMFLQNSCGNDGGAMTVVAAASVMFGSEDITFFQNSAHATGGAVSVKGVGVGLQFLGLTFISNNAQVGGAVYVTSSGTAITENQFGGRIETPTKFDRCKFIGNEAVASGGAIDTGAGLDAIVNTYFEGNTAGVGGALRLAGTASLDNCTFLENTSDEDEGPAVSNVGVVSSITACTFVDNTVNCEPGYFVDYHERNTSQGAFNVVCDGCGAWCHRCTSSRRIAICTKQLEHTKSPGGDATVEALKIDPGYWRSIATSRIVLPCYNADACRGGRTGASHYCSEGYEGPYCALCREGYSAGLGHTCRSCSGSITPIVITIILVSALLLMVSVLYFKGYGTSTTSGRALLLSWRRRLLSLKIIVIVWQVLTQFTSVGNIVFPDVYQVFLDGIELINLDLGWIISTDCIVDLDFHHRLFTSTLWPLVALGILGAMYVMAKRRRQASQESFMAMNQEEIDQKYLSMVLLLSFLVYSSVSSTLFQMFACDDLDGGKSYLRADYRIDCNSRKHGMLQIYAFCMIIFYTAGIPTLYGILIFRNRHILMDDSVRQKDAVAKSISNLWELYKPNRCYYELVECCRRIMLAGVVVFILPNTLGQVAVALMLATFFMVLSELMDPFDSGWDAWVNRMGHAIVFSSMYLALLLRIDVSNEREESQRVFEVLLIGGHTCMFLVAIFEGFVVTYQWFKRAG